MEPTTFLVLPPGVTPWEQNLSAPARPSLASRLQASSAHGHSSRARPGSGPSLSQPLPHLSSRPAHPSWPRLLPAPAFPLGSAAEAAQGLPRCPQQVRWGPVPPPAGFAAGFTHRQLDRALRRPRGCSHPWAQARSGSVLLAPSPAAPAGGGAAPRTGSCSPAPQSGHPKGPVHSPTLQPRRSPCVRAPGLDTLLRPSQLVLPGPDGRGHRQALFGLEYNPPGKFPPRPLPSPSRPKRRPSAHPSHDLAPEQTTKGWGEPSAD